MPKRDKILIFSSVSCMLLVVLVGLTYAYWSKTVQQTGDNVITPGCLDFTMMNEQDDISLQDAIPISDEQGKQLVPYKFTVKNTCTLAMEYRVNIEILSDTNLSLGFVDAVLDYGNVNLISSLNDADATITGATSKTLGTAKLNPDGERTHEFRIWLDKNVTPADDAQNKLFKAKIVIVGEPTEMIPPLCRRATDIHTEICNQSSGNGCGTSDSVGSGKTIVYGNTDTSNGILNVGDAFTCDINGDGEYDEEKERFYYLSPMYDTINSSEGNNVWNEDIAVLIYYNNTILSGDNVVSAQGSNIIKYNTIHVNNIGPSDELLSYLPKKNDAFWKNVPQVTSSRQIRNEKGSTYTGAGELPLVDYSGYVGRLVTYQEIENACGGTESNELDTQKCRFLLENTSYNYSYIYFNYWTDTPLSTNNSMVNIVVGSLREIFVDCVDFHWNRMAAGVRPVIELGIDDIEY